MGTPHAALEQAVYDLLATNIDGASVFQDVPDNYEGSTVTIGDLDGEPLATKDDTDWQLQISILSEVSADERKPVLDLMSQISTLLDRRRIITPAWQFQIIFSGDNAALDENGITYVGTSFFRAIALSAN